MIMVMAGVEEMKSGEEAGNVLCNNPSILSIVMANCVYSDDSIIQLWLWLESQWYLLISMPYSIQWNTIFIYQYLKPH